MYLEDFRLQGIIYLEKRNGVLCSTENFLFYVREGLYLAWVAHCKDSCLTSANKSLPRAYNWKGTTVQAESLRLVSKVLSHAKLQKGKAINARCSCSKAGHADRAFRRDELNKQYTFQEQLNRPYRRSFEQPAN